MSRYGAAARPVVMKVIKNNMIVNAQTKVQQSPSKPYIGKRTKFHEYICIFILLPYKKARLLLAKRAF